MSSDKFSAQEPATPTHRNSRYPYHLAKLVAQRLDGSGIAGPSSEVLLRLFETLYFASLKTDEARPCSCTINYIDPSADLRVAADDDPAQNWSVIPFHHPHRLDVRSLLKLADAADPTVSSLAVHCDEQGELMIWGMIDQELRYGDYIALDASDDPQRPGLFQATITGVGSISVYKNFALLGSLEQHNLVEEYHDVLWDGPVHNRLREHLHRTLLRECAASGRQQSEPHVAQIEDELLVRWQNAICRVLFNIQQYGHGGGLLIVPQCPAPKVNIKYQQTYNRMPRALFRLAQHQILKTQTAAHIADRCQSQDDLLPCQVHFDAIQYQRDLDQLKNELLGCVRFVASLSRVDGFVLLDESLVVHGFGVEARADAELTEVFLAGDARATPGLLRQVPISQFGTRHRAMMRYCDEHETALGFVISQDGDIRATMKYRGQLLLWENINVQLAYRAENRQSLVADVPPQTIAGMFQHWMLAVASITS